MNKNTKMIKEKYPEHLTEEESENYDFKAFNDSDTYKEDYFKAVAYQKKKGGAVYTMVDGEDNKTHYLKGLNYVNRFGYCVLKEIKIKW